MRAAPARFALLAAAALAAASVPPAPAAPPEEGRPLLVRAGTVIPVEGDPIRDGAVLCRAGRIAAVGPAGSIAAPAGAEVIDLGPHAVILPGLVAASSGLAAPGSGAPESVAPGVRALDGFDWFRPRKRELEGGITTAYLEPARHRLLGGQGAVVKMAGPSPEARTLVARAGLHGAVGDPARNPPALFEAPDLPDPVAHPLLPARPQSPESRMAAVALLREALARGKAAPAGDGDPGLAALAAVARGEEPLRLRTEEAADIRAALALAKEAGVRVVLEGARDAHLAADGIAAAGVPVVLLSPFVPGRVADPSDPEEAERRVAAMGNPAALAVRGVDFAIAAEDAALPDLLLVAAAHAREGLDAARAVRAVTLDAARILGVDGRVGSLVPGKDADLAAFSGDPFDVRSTAVLTVIDGAVAWRREPRAGVLVIRAAAVHTGTGEVFAPGAVVVEDGKIVEAGPSVGIPPGASVLDRPDGVVLPGFVDAHSRLGLRAGDRGDGSGNPGTAVPVHRALVPDDPSFAGALAAGITTAQVSPGGSGSVVGTTTVVKTGGGTMEERTLREIAGVEVSLAGSGDLPGALQNLRDLLKKAQGYHESWEKFEKEIKEYEKARKEYEAAVRKRAEEERKEKEAKAKAGKDGKGGGEEGGDDGGRAPADGEKKEKKEEEKKDGKDGKKEGKAELKEPKEPRRPDVDPSMEPWRDALRKKIPVLCRALSVPEVSGALKVIHEESKLDLVVVGGEEAWRVAADLKKASVGVLLGPRVVFPVRGREVNAARELAAAGVPFGFASDAAAGARDLPPLAAWAVRKGLGPAAAVRALTLDAARLLGVDDRVGSLERGKDADLVILDGDPFGAAVRVRAVYVGGKVVSGGE